MENTAVMEGYSTLKFPWISLCFKSEVYNPSNLRPFIGVGRSWAPQISMTQVFGLGVFSAPIGIRRKTPQLLRFLPFRGALQSGAVAEAHVLRAVAWGKRWFSTSWREKIPTKSTEVWGDDFLQQNTRNFMAHSSSTFGRTHGSSKNLRTAWRKNL